MKAEELSRLIRESSDVEKVEMFPGFWRQTLLSGESLMLCLFTLRKGADLPEHHHPHEQAGYVIYGAVELYVDGKPMITRTGCSYFIPSNVPHRAKALEDSLVVDAFSPPRSEYL